MKAIKHYQPLAAGLLLMASAQAHAIAVTNVEASASSLTNLSVVSESHYSYETNNYSYSNIYDVGKPYLNITDNKKGTITTQLLQNQETTTTSYKDDFASGVFGLNPTAGGPGIFRLNTTVNFDSTISKQTSWGYSYAGFSLGIGGNIVGSGAPLSEVPGLTSYQAPVWAISINGGDYQQLATSFNVNGSSFGSYAGIDFYSLLGSVLPDSTLNLSFLVYTNQDFEMRSFSYTYSSYEYDYQTATTPVAPKVLDTVITTYEVAPVPEADSYAMLLAGLSLVVAVVRRRQKAVA